MVSRTYIYLLAVSALLVSATGAYFSVSGLVELFAGTSLSVGIMASAMEFSKLVVVGFLYRFWGHIHRPLQMYLIFAVAVLMLVTSVGIYGYLSNAYQKASVNIHSSNMAIESLERENTRIVGQMHEMQNFIDQIPNSRMTKKFDFQNAYEPKLQALREKSEEVLEKIEDKKQELLTMQTKVGPVFYLGKAFGMDADSVVKYLILLFVSVFDPLAVSLVFGLNLIIRLREKYRGDEYKIGARSLTSPVDHRVKKAA
jgi:hypothetical protein